MFILTIVLDQQDGYCEIGLLKKVKSVFLKHTLLDTMLLLVQLAATHIEKIVLECNHQLAQLKVLTLTIVLD